MYMQAWYFAHSPLNVLTKNLINFKAVHKLKNLMMDSDSSRFLPMFDNSSWLICFNSWERARYMYSF